MFDVLAQVGVRLEEEVRFEFLALPQGVWGALAAGLALALLAAVVWMYRHEGRSGALARRRMMLASLRAGVLVTLALVWFEPVLARYLHRWVDSYTLVLVDTSASMDLVDRYHEPAAAARVRAVLPDQPAGESGSSEAGSPDAGAQVRRSALVEALLARDGRAFLTGLATHNRVRLHTFDSGSALKATLSRAEESAAAESGGASAKRGDEDAEVPLSAGEVKLAFPARGPVTDVDHALREAVEALGDAPLAGVVVFSDGGFNYGAGVEGAARFMRERRVPLFAVGIGDPSPPRNARVTELGAPDLVFPSDPFTISATLAAEGLAGESVQVVLRERTDGDSGAGQVIARRELPVAVDGALPPISFEHRQPRVGRYSYTVAVEPRPDESVVDDNERSVTLRVADSQTRVLLVAGEPSWEYQNLVRLLQRDSTFELACWLQSADARAVRDGDTILRHLPLLPEELFVYDVILLLDPDPAGFDPLWTQRIDGFITDQGGGLMYVAGRPHASAFMRSPELSSLVDLLPVTPNPDADLILNRVGHYQRREFGVDVPPAALPHTVMRAAEDEASSRLSWQGRGGVFWHFPVLRAKPVATVLMQHTDPAMQNQFGPHVLCATQFVGAGRTGFLAFDGTWRWRQSGAEAFARFWVQMLRFLAEGKLFRGDQRGAILTEGSEFPIGQAVSVAARLLTSGFEPLTQEEVSASVKGDDGATELRLIRRLDQPGMYEGRFVAKAAGGYQISLTPPGADPSTGTLTRDIRVVRPNLELARPQMDKANLMSLAAVSEGGRYLEVDELMQVPPLIADRHEVSTTKSRPTTLWDRWWTLALLAGLLTLEWAGRKWNRLL
ncbi:MAG: VWA domain-containing protein [Phycisphaerales bacterium]|nr:VWA domain-containing protein [Phycisphaerales bacterium]